MPLDSLLVSHLTDLEEYTPIQPFEVLSQRLGIPADQIVKLDANENPYGPLPGVAEALAEYPHYHIYPDPQQSELRGLLAAHLGVAADAIVASHGADELLDLLCRLFLAPGDAIINTPPTFGMYSFDAQLTGAQVIDVWRRGDYGVDVDGVESLFGQRDPALSVTEMVEQAKGSARRIKLLFLTSPNNPSGNWLPDDDLRRLLALPVMVVLDEAYVEFAEHPSRASWVAEHPNLVVLRTFSKAAGIAGLRLGYGIFPDWLLPHLWKFKQPYNVNVAAAVAGIASMRNLDAMQAVVEKLRQERARLYELLAQFPFLDPIPDSQANFILCRVVDRDAQELKARLEGQGILVRHYRKPGLENCIRISIGRPDQTDRLVEGLRIRDWGSGPGD
jgi:histidinol-phosphate aminotransferase